MWYGLGYGSAQGLGEAGDESFSEVSTDSILSDLGDLSLSTGFSPSTQQRFRDITEGISDKEDLLRHNKMREVEVHKRGSSVYISSRPGHSRQGSAVLRRPRSRRSARDDSGTSQPEEMDDGLNQLIRSLQNRKSSLGSAISHVIAEEEAQKAREAEEKRIAAERAAQERKKAEERRLAEEKQRKEEAERQKKLEAEKRRKEAEEREKARVAAAAEAERKKAAEAEVKRQAEEAAKKANQKSGFVSRETIEEEYAKCMELIKDIKQNITLAVKQNKPIKSACFKMRGEISKIVGQLTTSRREVDTKANNLLNVLQNAKQQDPLIFRWGLMYLSKAVVSQLESEVISSPEKVMPLAYFLCQLLMKVEELYPYIVARLVKRCPFLIGYNCSISTDEGRKKMGWKKDAEGKWEDEGVYNDRIGAISSLWGAMIRLDICSRSYLPYSRAWEFVSRQLNTDVNLITNATFTVLSSWWDSGAQHLLRVFGAQGEKLLTATVEDLVELAKDAKFPSAGRLKVLGKDWREGRMSQHPDLSF